MNLGEVEVLDSWEDMDERQLDRHAAEYAAKKAEAMAQAKVRTMMAEPVGPAPALKILKRPDGPKDANGVANGEADPRQRPVKSLVQRQKDYDEARRRIMGQDNDKPQQIKSEPIRIQNSARPPRPTMEMDLMPRNDAMNVLRAPRGPDGSGGFHLRR